MIWACFAEAIFLTLEDIAVLQDPGIERIAFACNAVVEGDDPLFKTFDHRQVRTSVTQLENVNGKAANVDDVGNRIGLERTVLCYSSRKCLRIAEDFAMSVFMKAMKWFALQREL